MRIYENGGEMLAIYALQQNDSDEIERRRKTSGASRVAHTPEECRKFRLPDSTWGPKVLSVPSESL